MCVCNVSKATKTQKKEPDPGPIGLALVLWFYSSPRRKQDIIFN
jgi:hypothetical protein